MAYKLINYTESADRVTSGENILYTISYDIKEESSIEVLTKTKQLSIHQSIEEPNLSIAIVSDLLFNVNVMSNQLTSGLPVVGVEEVIEVVEVVVEETPVVEIPVVEETPVEEEVAPAIDSFTDNPTTTETVTDTTTDTTTTDTTSTETNG